MTDPKNAPLDGLREAIGLYHGEFLEGFYTLHADPFDEWVRQKREEFHTLILNGLHLLADRYLAAAEYDAGLTATRRLLLLDPWNEEAHRKQMTLLVLAGQRAAALTQYQTCVQILAEELRVAPMAETTAIYLQIRDDLPPEQPKERPESVSNRLAPKTLGAAPLLPHNLPRQLTPLVGRVHESTAVRNKVLDPAYPLVTIVGEGGVGKTRLALTVAQTIMAGPATGLVQEGLRRSVWSSHPPVPTSGNGPRPTPFTDGVWFVPLADLSIGNNLAEQLADAIASVVGLELLGDAPLKTQLFARLAGKQLLLILDNFEQLGPGVDFLVELLQCSYHLKLLVTSRHRLNLQAEFVYRLEGLTAPDPTESDDWSSQALLDFDSVQLFLERANRTTPGFTLTPENQSHVLAICHFVEGLPLGIELAAALIEHHDIALIVQQLTNNYALLAGNLADLAPRHQSMRRVLDYSWQLLTIEEAQILAQCSVFHGGFTLEAATKVTGATPLQLESLVHQSLLRYADEARFALHELVQQYAAQQLNTMPAQKAAVMSRYYGYYLNLLYTNQEYLPVHRQIAAAMQLEFDNIRYAWSLAVTAGDVEALAKGLDGLMHCCELLGRYKVGEALIGQARHWFEEEERPADEIQADLQGFLARLWLAQGYLGAKLGNLAEAMTNYGRALETGRRLSAPWLLADGQFRVAALWLVRGNYRVALAIGDEALQWAKQSSNSTLESKILTIVGIAHGRLGAQEQAHTFFLQALQRARRQGAKEVEAFALLNLGELHQQTGNFAEALHSYQQALFLLRRLDKQQGIATVLYHLGALLMTIGAFDEARTQLEQALEILRRISDRYYEELILTKLSNLFCQTGLYEKAEAYQEQAQRLAASAGHDGILAEARLYAGRLWVQRGQEHLASSAFTQALSFWQENGQTGWARAAQIELAWLAYQRGDQWKALGCIEPLIAKDASAFVDFSADPLLMAWRCYEILRANQDERAMLVLHAAYQQLQKWAATIHDHQLRHLFLTEVAHHQAITQAVQTQKR